MLTMQFQLVAALVTNCIHRYSINALLVLDLKVKLVSRSLNGNLYEKNAVQGLNSTSRGLG